MPQYITNEKSTLVQVIAWCHQATIHYLNQCSPRSMSPYGVTRPQCVNHEHMNYDIQTGNTSWRLDKNAIVSTPAVASRNDIKLTVPRIFFRIISHFLLIHFFFTYSVLYQPYLGLCQAQCVQSRQRQPMSAVAITACEVQVSAADSQTVRTVATGV